MKNKINKRKFIRYILLSWMPVSRKKVDKLRLQVLEIFAAQREMQMTTRQDVMLLASRMVKFHGPGIVNDDKKNSATKMKQTMKVKDNTENMYG